MLAWLSSTESGGNQRTASCYSIGVGMSIYSDYKCMFPSDLWKPTYHDIDFSQFEGVEMSKFSLDFGEDIALPFSTDHVLGAAVERSHSEVKQ